MSRTAAYGMATGYNQNVNYKIDHILHLKVNMQHSNIGKRFFTGDKRYFNITMVCNT